MSRPRVHHTAELERALLREIPPRMLPGAVLVVRFEEPLPLDAMRFRYLFSRAARIAPDDVEVRCGRGILTVRVLS